MVTLHVSVWVEITTNAGKVRTYVSRSMWACELKFRNWSWPVQNTRHAPRERVSWNRQSESGQEYLDVTLNVSVWVEITDSACYSSCCWSRSTWACELKSLGFVWSRLSPLSRSTWACELKFELLKIYIIVLRHAPRERVSWNLKYLKYWKI